MVIAGSVVEMHSADVWSRRVIGSYMKLHLLNDSSHTAPKYTAVSLCSFVAMRVEG